MSDKLLYNFSWDLIGDLDIGRPNLGRQTRVEVYRLLQFSLRDVIEKKFGTEAADQVFFEAGHLAGQNIYDQMLKECSNFSELVRQLQSICEDLKIGILRFEESDIEQKVFVMTVAEDLDCSGLPELDYEVCRYDEGFLAGIMERFFKIKFDVKEVNCWCTGDRTCRFKAVPA